MVKSHQTITLLPYALNRHWFRDSVHLRTEDNRYYSVEWVNTGQQSFTFRYGRETHNPTGTHMNEVNVHPRTELQYNLDGAQTVAQFVAMTVDGATAKIYVGGLDPASTELELIISTAISSTTFSDQFSGDVGRLCLGMDPQFYVQGQSPITNVVLLDRGLTQAEIETGYYNRDQGAVLDPSATDYVAWWPMTRNWWEDVAGDTLHLRVLEGTSYTHSRDPVPNQTWYDPNAVRTTTTFRAADCELLPPAVGDAKHYAHPETSHFYYTARTQFKAQSTSNDCAAFNNFQMGHNRTERYRHDWPRYNNILALGTSARLAQAMNGLSFTFSFWTMLDGKSGSSQANNFRVSDAGANNDGYTRSFYVKFYGNDVYLGNMNPDASNVTTIAKGKTGSKHGTVEGTPDVVLNDNAAFYNFSTDARVYVNLDRIYPNGLLVFCNLLVLDRALSQAEVTALFRTGDVRTLSQHVAVWCPMTANWWEDVGQDH
ncbi:hypothetical protein CYMTET_45330 [Cymbomonas tetramitiformis]|uniref:Uncharacterized protein n=1 Tax=Cymbomonas tetramitiformis TaxID=36881 RepID=A0AAE0BYG3_9CHLO|nr:hypothetical protein CYMTET_45330 [Cymbomonas tetramitiformis]